MTENRNRRIEDRLPGQPLQWDEESANDEILALHRQLAAEKLRADTAEQRATAKSQECIELRERMAAAPASQAQAAPVAKVIINDGKGTATIMLAPEASLPVGASLYLAAPAVIDQPTAAEIRALKTIAEFPVTDPGNMDAWNMQAIAINALASKEAAPAEVPSPDYSIRPVKVVRDKEGAWSHPGIPNFDEDYKSFAAWVKAVGLETTYKTLESEGDENPVYVSYFALEESSFAAWEPTPPEGAGWFTFSIHDTEDGPVWVWARRAGVAA